MAQINLTFKGKFIDSFTINGEVTIGSTPSNDIHIDSLAVRPLHAKITNNHNNFTITAMSTEAKILINGQKVTSQQLQDGDHIQVGKHTLEFVNQMTYPETSPDENMDSPMPVMHTRKKEAFLQVLNGSNIGKTISLTRSLSNLGKSGVQTAVIAHREDGYYLSHLEGKNSPAVNNKPIGDNSYKLKSGDSIQIGNVKLLFSLS